MLVFIDESGDPGFKVSKSSSPLFAVAMVIFVDGNAAHQTNRVIVTAKERPRVKPEFKFTKAPHDKFEDKGQAYAWTACRAFAAASSRLRHFSNEANVYFAQVAGNQDFNTPFMRR